MPQYTLSHTFELWRNSKEAKMVDANFEKYLSLALRLYVFPKLNPKAESLSSSEFSTFCDTFLVEDLKDALNIFDLQFASAVQANQTARSTGRNYRSALKRFIRWLEKQGWWRGLFPDPVVKVTPARVKVPPKPGTGVKKLSLYGLVLEDLPGHLHDELEEFRQFRLDGGRNIRRTVREDRARRKPGEARRPKISPVKPSTLKSDEEQILRFLGWYVEHQLFSEECRKLLSNVSRDLKADLRSALFTDCKKHYLFEIYLNLYQEFWKNLSAELHLGLLTDPDLLYDCTDWAIETRGVCYSFGVNLTKTAIAVAKWINYDKSKRYNWSDIAIILELKDLRNEFAEDYALDKQKLDAEKWAIKELTHEEARKVVQYLRLLCAPNTRAYDKKTGTHKHSQKRSISAVARMWQIYLIVKILVYCPVRQEEIRNLKLGETLLRQVDQQGDPYYVVYLKEHKRSSESKERHYRLPTILTEDLDLWVYKWRPLIENALKSPEHWMKFWGHKVDKVEALQQSLKAAEQGDLPKTVKNSSGQYIAYLEKRLKGVERRFETWEIAKQNFESHSFLFFKFGKNGKNDTQSFGKPHDVTSIWRVVIYAIARATKALFGEARWTNPHKLRNIAEKHIRQPGKPDITEAFATFIGHSKEMGDEYAEQITSEYELTEGIVDDWWQEVI